MEIIAGTARGVTIQAPQGVEVRPTAVRARRSLLDSLRVFEGLKVADLCAGSGAMGLEAASRGAAEVLFVEAEAAHCRMIEENIGRVKKTGAIFEAVVVRADILKPSLYRHCLAGPDLIFADPPYAESAALFAALTAEREFLDWSAGARIVWELPDALGSAGEFLAVSIPGRTSTLRKLGPARFLFVE